MERAIARARPRDDIGFLRHPRRVAIASKIDVRSRTDTRSRKSWRKITLDIANRREFRHELLDQLRRRLRTLSTSSFVC